MNAIISVPRLFHDVSMITIFHVFCFIVPAISLCIIMLEFRTEYGTSKNNPLISRCWQAHMDRLSAWAHLPSFSVCYLPSCMLYYICFVACSSIWFFVTFVA